TLCIIFPFLALAASVSGCALVETIDASGTRTIGFTPALTSPPTPDSPRFTRISGLGFQGNSGSWSLGAFSAQVVETPPDCRVVVFDRADLAYLKNIEKESFCASE